MSFTLWKELKSSPVKTMAKWQDYRFLWLLMSFTSLFLVIIAHSLFQNYIYMLPCEQCVYIRFAFFCMFFAGLIAAIKPKNIFLKILGYTLAFYGVIKGIYFSLKLDAIHTAAHDSENIFGVQGCSTEPTFPFGLPLDKWFPDWFMPTGDCGFDYPVVPSGVELNALQSWFVELYKDGWYLFPSSHFINMAQSCLFAFSVCLAILGVMFISWIVENYIKKTI